MYPDRIVIVEEVRQLWQLLRYKGHGNEQAVKAAADHLEGFLKLLDRNAANRSESGRVPSSSRDEPERGFMNDELEAANRQIACLEKIVNIACELIDYNPRFTNELMNYDRKYEVKRPFCDHGNATNAPIGSCNHGLSRGTTAKEK